MEWKLLANIYIQKTLPFFFLIPIPNSHSKEIEQFTFLGSLSGLDG